MARRYDISRLQPAVTTPDGRVRADAHLTRCGIFSYHNPDGSVRRELRLREDVMSPASLASFAGVPVTDDHPPEMLDSQNARQFAVGALGDSIVPDDDHVRGKLNIFDAGMIAKMRAGKLDVSCGYNCDLDETPGEHPEYGHYDAIQKNIVGNHIAIVDRGRAGSARARMDSVFHEDPNTDLRAPHEDVWSDEARQAAIEARQANAKGSTKASSVAHDATQTANKSGKIGDHLAAVKAHLTALRAAKDVGDKAAASVHEKAMAVHAQAADKLAKAPAGKANAKSAPMQRSSGGPSAEQTWANLRATASAGKFLKKDSVDELVLVLQAFASVQELCQNQPMAKRTDEGSPDPEDEASREARGENDAKASGKAHDPVGTEDSDDDDDDQDDDSDDEDEMDAADAPMDLHGNLSDDDEHKIGANTFAVPKRKGLPIHDPKHCQAAMDGFGDYEFKGPEEKHAAFNRTYKKAIDFNIPKSNRHAFQAAHGSKLDRADAKDLEYMNDLKIAKAELQTQTKARKDAEDKLAAAQGEIASLKTDLQTKTKERTDAEDGAQARMDSKIDLLVKATAAGAEVNSKMSEKQIQIALIKHVDKKDVAEDTHPEYVRALYEGALGRSTKDAQDTKAGQEALSKVREIAEVPRRDSKTALDDEAETARKMRDRSTNAWSTSSTKENN